MVRLFHLTVLFYLRSVHTAGVSSSINATLVYQIPYVDYDWPSDADRTSAISNGDYVVENNLIAGLKVFGDTVYVTVPRWKNGVPSSLNTLVRNPGGDIIMQPFPSWDMNKKGDCSAIQYAQSMEIDPNTGFMWIIDTGRLNLFGSPENLCSPKIVILDIATNSVVRAYEFPDNVVSSTSNFLNDIILDYVDGEARFAYISDAAGDGKICVYDYAMDESYFFEDDSMKSGVASSIAPVDGIAMSHDFLYVYYSPLGSLSLFAVPTSMLRDKTSDISGRVTTVGAKSSGSDGMMCGRRSLFYSGLDDDSVYKVTVESEGDYVSMATEERVIWDSEQVQWPDTFGFNGTDLWFVANKISQFQSKSMDFSGSDVNMYIWKLGVGEHGYLWHAAKRTSRGTETDIVG